MLKNPNAFNYNQENINNTANIYYNLMIFSCYSQHQTSPVTVIVIVYLANTRLASSCQWSILSLRYFNTLCISLKAISPKHVCNITFCVKHLYNQQKLTELWKNMNVSTKFRYETPQKTACDTCFGFSFEKCSYNTLLAYLCITSEILSNY